MARPTENRTITKRFRVNAVEEARLASDAAEATKGNESAFIKNRVFAGPPLATGKGMKRPDLLECLQLNTALQGKLRGKDPDADRAMQRQAELILKALQDDH